MGGAPSDEAIRHAAGGLFRGRHHVGTHSHDDERTFVDVGYVLRVVTLPDERLAFPCGRQ